MRREGFREVLVLEKRKEKKMAFGIDFQSWVLGRRVNKKRERIQSGFVENFDYG